MILGAVIGSALDSRPQSNFHFRYAIRLGNGNITSQDVFSSEPFRHPAGVCVLLPQVSIAPDQSLCSQTADSLRNAYISNKTTPVAEAVKVAHPNPATQKNHPPKAAPSTDQDLKLINCKLNNLAPVITTVEKCALINGAIIK